MARIIRRFLLIYLSFVLIMVVVLVPLYQITLNELKRDAVRTYRQVLVGGLEEFEKALDDIVISGLALYNDPNVLSLTYLRMPYDGRQAYQAWQSLRAAGLAKSGMSIARESGILFANGAVLTQDRFFVTIDEYYGVFLSQMGADDVNMWANTLRGEGGAFTLQAMRLNQNERAWDAVVFSMPLPLNAKSGGCLFFCAIPVDAIISLLTLPELLSGGSLRVYGPDGRALVRTPGETPNALTISERNEKYGLKAELFVDPALISGSMSGYRKTAVAMALAALAVSVAIAVIYALKNARPVMHIVSAANELSRGAGELLPSQAPGQSEFQYLNEFIGQVRSQLNRDKQRLSHQEILIIENLFERLLRDEAYSQGTFLIAERYLPDFPREARMTLFRLMDVGEQLSADYSHMQTRLLEIVKGVINAQLYAHFTADMLVLITQAQDETEQFIKGIREIRESALNALDVELRVAISLPFSGLDKLGQVFRGLRHALRFSVGAQSEPYLQTRASFEGAIAGVSTAKFTRFLLAGDAERALKCIEEDLQSMRDAGAGEADAQQTYYLYRFALISAAADAPAEARLSAPPPLYSAESAREDPFEGIREAARDFAQAVKDYKDKDDESIESAVLRAIDENIGNTELCVSLITERFSISESHLRRVMHRATGDTFFGYVESKRMARAKRLLSQTDLAVREIMQKCGYASQNSFYKAFKRYCGVPPSAYRALGEARE